jgi:hypothetical protein
MAECMWVGGRRVRQRDGAHTARTHSARALLHGVTADGKGLREQRLHQHLRVRHLLQPRELGQHRRRQGACLVQAGLRHAEEQRLGHPCLDTRDTEQGTRQRHRLATRSLGGGSCASAALLLRDKQHGERTEAMGASAWRRASSVATCSVNWSISAWRASLSDTSLCEGQPQGSVRDACLLRRHEALVQRGG